MFNYSSVPGIDQVIIRGAQKKNIYISARPDDLKKNGLTLQQLEQLILSQNIPFPIGEVRSSDQVLPIRINEKVNSLKDIETIQIPKITALEEGFF